MTDEEYLRFLTALAGKHLRYPRPSLPFIPYFGQLDELRAALDRVSGTLRLLKVVKDPEDPALPDYLIKNLRDFRAYEEDAGLRYSPVRIAVDQMEAVGILDALDDAPDLVLGELRRSAIPGEEEEVLRSAGFDGHDIEVLLTLAVHQAHALALSKKLPSDIAEEAARTLPTVLKDLKSPPPEMPAKKKRKILNGIGKLLGGAVAGIGNVLLVTGTLAAPNPATGYAAIASGGIAVSSFFAGLGDIKGE